MDGCGILFSLCTINCSSFLLFYIFTFIEENTLPTVWFSNFSMSESSNDLRLSGESNNMETLSHQISILENNKDYVSNINILNSQVGTGGTIRFVLNASLNPEIFKSKTVIQSNGN